VKKPKAIGHKQRKITMLGSELVCERERLLIIGLFFTKNTKEALTIPANTS